MHELCRYSECCYSLSVLFAELSKLGVTIYYSWMEGGGCATFHSLPLYLFTHVQIDLRAYVDKNYATMEIHPHSPK